VRASIDEYRQEFLQNQIFHDLYGNYISRQLIDSAAVFAPLVEVMEGDPFEYPVGAEAKLDRLAPKVAKDPFRVTGPDAERFWRGWLHMDTDDPVTQCWFTDVFEFNAEKRGKLRLDSLETISIVKESKERLLRRFLYFSKEYMIAEHEGVQQKHHAST